jgi:hypothetical protein
MRNIFVLLFIFIASICYAQTPLQSVLKTYFRSHPFDIKFSSFITSLQKDPLFTTEEYNRRTDSTFFFLSGTYKNFNPFRFTPKEVRLIVAEEEIIHDDSLYTHDTIINLQLMGILDSASVNSKIVEKEFNRFNSNQANRFSSKTYNSNEIKGTTVTGTYNYFVFPLIIAPVTIAWGRIPKTLDHTFTIIIRFKVRENTANYILMPNEQL